MMRRKLVLASNSPRRRELIAGLDRPWEVRVLPGIGETYPPDMPAEQIAPYLATQKAQPYIPTIGDDEIVVTADTVVIIGGEVLGKPSDVDDARRMLRKLSGQTHQVVTGVCLTWIDDGVRRRSFSAVTDVTFKVLTDDEINYYVDTYRPLDKAGAYGVQEWIGYVGVTSLHGSFYNVMGLPVQRLYNELLTVDSQWHSLT